MASSGSTNWTQTRNELVNASLRKCGKLAEGETATAQQVEDACRDLNALVKGLHAEGVKIWAYSELTLFLDTTSQEYDLGTGGDHCILTSSLVETTLAADVALGASTITVASATGIATTYNIGVVQDDDTIHWTTVNGAPSGVTITLTAVTTAAATSGNAVYVYVSKAPRPLRIEQARIRTSSTSETVMTKMSRLEYFGQANKSATGVPSGYHYSPQLSLGKFYSCPVSSTVAYRINMTAYRVLEDFDASSDNPDFPQEWFQPLVWLLARELGPEYGVDGETWNRIITMADYWYGKALGFDTDTESVVIVPDME